VRVVLAVTATENGGVWRHVKDLHAGLAARGHDVVYALPSAARELWDEASSRGEEVLTQDEALSRGADVWHAHLHRSFDTNALWGMVRGHRAGGVGAVVSTEHLPRNRTTDRAMSVDPSLPQGVRKPGARWVKTLMKRWEVSHVERVICVSEASRQFFCRRFGVPPTRVVAIPNGVPTPRAIPEFPSGDLHVVGVGSLCWRKGFDVLVEAAGMARENWSVTVHGGGPWEGHLRALAELGSAGRVVFAGHCADGAAAPGRGHVLCLPSRAESSPYSVIEAMALGRAVVGTRVDGIPELVPHGECGLLVAPGSPGELAAALDTLARDRNLVEEMGAAARRRQESMFTVDRMVDATAAVYATVREGARVCS